MARVRLSNMMMGGRRAPPDYTEVHKPENVAKFEKDLAARDHGRDIRTYPVEVNDRLMRLFEGHQDLTDDEVLSGAAILYGPRGWSPWFVCGVAGNLVGWGLHLSIIEAHHAPDGTRLWRMEDREMRFADIGGRAVQIRGLEPEAQARMDRNRRATAKRNATLQRNHAIKVRAEVQRHLAEIVRLDPETLIPEMAIRSQGLIPDDIEKRWPRLAEAAGLLIDLHHGWSRNLQKKWVYDLKQEVKAAQGRRVIRERDAHVQQERLAEEAALDAALAEDADALAGLEDL